MAKKRKLRAAQVEWYGDDFQRIVEEHGPEALFYAAEVVQREADRRVPVGRTGNLKQSGYVYAWGRTTYTPRRYWRKKVRVNNETEAVIAYSAPHAHLIEGGRRAARKKIVPRAKSGAQALLIGGQYRAWARQRRIAAQPFLGPALEAAGDAVVEELATRFRSWLERLLPAAR